MKKLNIIEENFSTIREELKKREQVRVNEKITLVSFEANTQRIAESGKVVRTPFYYVADNGEKFTSVTLKKKLGIALEKKGERKTTTFAVVWEQAAKLASDASDAEIAEAIKTLQEIQKERKEAEKARLQAIEEAERAEYERLKAKFAKKRK